MRKKKYQHGKGKCVVCDNQRRADDTSGCRCAPYYFNDFAKYGIEKIVSELGYEPDKCPYCGSLRG